MRDTGCLNKRRLSVVKHFPHCYLEVVTMILPHIYELHIIFSNNYTLQHFVHEMNSFSRSVVGQILLSC